MDSDRHAAAKPDRAFNQSSPPHSQPAVAEHGPAIPDAGYQGAPRSHLTSPVNLLALQRSMGNQAVQCLLAHHGAATEALPRQPVSAAPAPVQRVFMYDEKRIKYKDIIDFLIALFQGTDGFNTTIQDYKAKHADQETFEFMPWFYDELDKRGWKDTYEQVRIGEKVSVPKFISDLVDGNYSEEPKREENADGEGIPTKKAPNISNLSEPGSGSGKGKAAADRQSPALDAFAESLQTLYPAFLETLSTSAHELQSHLSIYKVQKAEYGQATEILHAVIASKRRPAADLIDLIKAMSPEDADQLATYPEGGISENIQKDIVGYDITDAEIRSCAIEQQLFYRNFQELPSGVDMLEAPEAMDLVIMSWKRKPDDVRGHVLRLLKNKIQRQLSGFDKAAGLPKNTTRLLAASQNLVGEQILRPGQILKDTPVYTLDLLEIYARIDGRPPQVKYPQPAIFDEFINDQLKREAVQSEILPAQTNVKVAQTMVLGKHRFCKVECEHGLLWVPDDCVKVFHIDYKIPTTESGQEISLYGVENKPMIKHIQQGNLGNCYLIAALISVVNKDPGLITTMLHELSDGTVAVRFYKRDDKRKITRIPEWVRVDKNIVFQDKQSVYAGINGALWPAIIEKAFAAHMGREAGVGLEGTGQGGKSSAVFEVILGQEALHIYLPNPKRYAKESRSQISNLPPNPLSMNKEQLQGDFEFTEPQAKQFCDLAGKEGQRISGTLGASEDRATVLAIVRKIFPKLELLILQERAIEAYILKHLPEGDPLAGNYTERARSLHRSIERGLKKNKVIALGTKKWNDTSHGPAGEAVSAMGLAGPHAYAVLRANTAPDRLTLTIRNPWGRIGMGYKKTVAGYLNLGQLLDIPPLERYKIESPEFEIDIEDVIRFCNSVYIA